MKSLGTLEDILRNAGQSGWDFFDQIDPKIRQRLEVRDAKQKSDRDTIAAAWARFAASDDGAMAVQALLDTTLFRTVFFVDLGTDPAAMTAFGAFREGQNALALAIVRQIQAGRELDQDQQPKPRDTADAQPQISDPGTGPVLQPRGRRGGRPAAKRPAAKRSRRPAAK